MFFKLFLVFIILPIIELALLIRIGILIGVFYTIVLIFITAIVGSFMVRREGLSVLYRFQENFARGVFPAEELFDGALILIAGALLITPGILTDFIGFLLVFSPSRAVIKHWIKGYIRKKIGSGDIHIHFKGDS